MIAMVGPLPPPVHGFSWVNQQMHNGLLLRDSVSVWDRSKPILGRGFFSRIVSVANGVIQAFLFFLFLFRRRPSSLYLGLSGGMGMLLDIPFILFSRLFGIKVFVHHHAFSYLNSPNLIYRFCFWVMADCYHIVLCERMGEILCGIYKLPVGRTFVLSNAAFLTGDLARGISKQGRMRIGFLSNISVEKGIIDFFDLAENFLGCGDSPEFLIAGPVGLAVSEVFAERLKALPNVKHVGPVYGDDKEIFYRSLDLLVFPTRYANEAEPVTILEALRAGVPVAANKRGCIGTMLNDSYGLGVTEAADFVSDASDWINRLLASPDELERLKISAKARFEELHFEHARRLEMLLDRIAAGSCLEISS